MPPKKIAILTTFSPMNLYQTIDPKTLSPVDRHQYILSLVSPRPIAFVSTLSSDGIPNLAPFSYFTALSSTPPIIGFSCNLNQDGSEKDTLQNIKSTKECVVNIVSHQIVDPVEVCSQPFESNVSEFDMSKLTEMPSDLVKPHRVTESRAQMECRLKDIINYSQEPGATNFVICDVVRIHCREDDYMRPHRLDPVKLAQVGRMGRKYYTRVTKESIFEM